LYFVSHHNISLPEYFSLSFYLLSVLSAVFTFCTRKFWIMGMVLKLIRKNEISHNSEQTYFSITVAW